MIVPLAPGRSRPAARVPAAAGRQPRRRGQGRQRPRHALRVPRQRHEDALRHRLRRRLGHLHRRLRDEDPRLPGHHRLRVGGLAGDPQPGGEGLPRQAPGHGRRLVRRQRPDGGGDAAAEAPRRRRSTSSWTRSATSRTTAGTAWARRGPPGRPGYEVLEGERHDTHRPRRRQSSARTRHRRAGRHSGDGAALSARSRTTARTSCSTSTTRGPAASSCAG